MKKKCLIFFLLTLTLQVFGQWVTLNEETELFSLKRSTIGETKFSFQLDGYENEIITQQTVSYTKISHPLGGELLAIGKPDLPIFTTFIAIADQGTPQLDVVYKDLSSVNNICIYPRQQLQSESIRREKVFVIDKDYYQSQKQFPQNRVILGNPIIMRDLRIVPVTIQPFIYNPETETLDIYSDIDITITTKGSDGKNHKKPSEQISRAFHKLYKAVVLNYDTLSYRNLTFQDPSYLFITPNNDQVSQYLDYLIQWKKEKGFEVATATTEVTGTTINTIKNYIQNAYDTWENPPEYVCLVGDAGGSFSLPTGHMDGGGYNGEGDHYYTELAGDDMIADIFIGRLSFNSISELQTVVAKILNYEKTPYLVETDWYNQAVVVGDPSGSGPSTIDTKIYVETMMNQYAPEIEVTEVFNGPWVTNITNNINEGRLFFNYRGFGGMSGWNNYDIEALNNGFMLPVATALTCNTGDFEGTWDSISEAFLKAGTPTSPKGAIAAISTATGNTHTCFNNCVDAGIYYGIFPDSLYNMGAALARGKLNLSLNYPGNPNNSIHKFSYWNNLMGDPGMEIWTGIPKQIVVNHPEIVNSSSDYLHVSVTTPLNIPVKNAWISLYNETTDENIILYSDNAGQAYFPVDQLVVGSYILSVTHHNNIPYQGNITIASNAQVVSIGSIIVDDSQGNGDQIMNPGETINLDISLVNHLNSDLQNVSATLNSAQDFIEISNNNISYGTISANTEQHSSDTFTCSINATLPGNIPLYFDLDISSETLIWTDHFCYLLEGPDLLLLNVEIDNESGILDPGESANIIVSLMNQGTTPAQDLSITLSCEYSGIEIDNDTAMLGSLAEHQTIDNSSNPFTISSSAQLVPGMQIPLVLTAETSTGLQQELNLVIPVGEVTIIDPLGPDAAGYYVYDDGDINYLEVPEYNWIETNPNQEGYGTTLNFSDNGNSGSSQTINLPINFKFYNEDYSTITICSNGWISPGSTDSESFMNWTIPGSNGPSPLIAPFWDDLIVNADDVSYFYDAANSSFIVQWNEVSNEYDYSLETFEVILYDYLQYPSLNGNSLIKFQYKEINNIDQGEYGWGVEHGQYATVGIEDPTSTIGLQYTYNNTYPTAAKHLQNEMAILFTALPMPSEGPYLLISDLGINSGGNNIIEFGETAYLSSTIKNIGLDSANNILISLELDDEYVTITDGEENYGNVGPNDETTINNAFVIDVSEEVPDHHYVNLVANITCDENTWERNINLVVIANPYLAVDTNIIDVEVGQNETFQTQMEISNSVAGSGNLHYKIRIEEQTKDRSIDGSSITNNTYVFDPGTTVEWVFSVHNLSSDSEWITDINMHFPYGTTVTGATSMVGGSGGDMSWDGTIGENVNLNWHGSTDLGYGYLHQNQVATGSVTVEIDEVFTGNVLIDYELIGDGYGNNPHIVSDVLEIKYPLGWVSVNPHEGDLSGGESEIINITFDTETMELGNYLCNLIINDGSAYETVIPINLDVVVTDSEDDIIPLVTQLTGNYPNPFNPETNISFSLKDAGDIQVIVHNVKGEKVKTLAKGYFEAANYNLTWQGDDDNGNSVASGIYFYQMITKNYNMTKKMILMK